MFPARTKRCFLLGLLLLARAALAGDWPAWRCDAQRSAASPDPLPHEISLLWWRDLAPPSPAWPSEPRLRFDAAAEPVVAGETLYAASSSNDTLLALDTETGAERWRFTSGAPLRFAPACAGGRVYQASDDGFLYCLDAARGEVLWRFRGGPSGRRVLGNGRLVSAWPARGGPIVDGGVVFFAAGIWPFQGVFVHALDAATGAVVWVNDSGGSLWIHQPHHSTAFGGLAPQGYLALAGDRLLVPNGRSAVACLDAKSGELLYFHLVQNHRRESFHVSTSGGFFFNGGLAYRLADGAKLGALEADGAVLGADTAWTASFSRRQETGKPLPAPHAVVVRSHELHQRTELDAYDLSLDWQDEPRGIAYRFEAAKGKPRRLVRTTLSSGKRSELPVTRYGEGEHKDAAGRKRVAVEIAFTDALVRGVGAAGAGAGPETCEVTGRFFVSTPALECRGDLSVRFAGAKTGAAESKSSSGKGAKDDKDDDSNGDKESYGVSARVPGLDAWRERSARTTSGAPAAGVIPGLASRLRLEPQWKLEEPVVETHVETPDAPPASGAGLDPARGSAAAPVVVKAGPRLYVGVPGRVLVVALGDGTKAKPAVVQRLDVPGVPGSLAAADAKLFVSTLEGRLLAFGEGERLSRHPRRSLRLDRIDDDLGRRVEAILAHTGVRSGHALLCGAGRWAEEVTLRSSLDVVVLDRDRERAAAARRRFDDAGLYGTRLSVLLEGDDLALRDLPPYFASLILFGDGDSADWRVDKDLIAESFRVLRPYGGVLCLPASARRAAEVDSWARDAGLENTRVSEWEGWTLLRREGALPGAGSWTHQYGDAAQSGVSRDTRVRLPLGLLWFGGPSNEKLLPRHGHGPSPEVAGGRIVIEGPDLLRALDVYTGRLLWETALPGLGDDYNRTSHQPGANALGSNYVTTADSVYVAHDDRCLRLDAESGSKAEEFRLDADPETLEAPRWGFLAVSGDLLVAGVSPVEHTRADFDASELSHLKGKDLERLESDLKSLSGYPRFERGDGEGLRDFVVRNLNALVRDPGLAAALAGREPRSGDRGSVESLLGEIERRRRERPQGAALDGALVRLQRRLLECFVAKLPEAKTPQRGAAKVWDGTGSRRLVGLKRFGGERLWSHEARSAFRHNAIALGGGRVFAIDRLPDEVAKQLRRRGKRAEVTERLIAVDARSGEVLWTRSEGVFGTWLAWSEDHDVLLQAGRPSRDMLPDEPSDRLVCLRARDGEVLWDKKTRYQGPCLLHHDLVLTQSKAYRLLDGDRVSTVNPITLEPERWGYVRNYGCNHAVASEHLLTFRSAAAGFFDLEGQGGTGNFGGFRSGCTSNLIVADGVLSAPDYTRTCTCSFQNQSSLALVPASDVEVWTFNDLEVGKRRVRRLGLNLGAPGDRRVDDGTLWIELPVVSGPSPDVDVEVEPETALPFQAHSSRLGGAGHAWVNASGLEGLRLLRVRLRGGAAESGTKKKALAPSREAVAQRSADLSAAPDKAAEGDFDPDGAPDAGGSEHEAAELAADPDERRVPDSVGDAKASAAQKLPYTVRLYFAEPRRIGAGERVFDVFLQGRKVLEGFDVVREAGGPLRGVVREYRGVFAGDAMELRLEASGGERRYEPILCGLELHCEAER